ncbi:MAG: peptidoglycan LD-endopeptidase LytH [Gaiellales bacterium]|nr:peptidoglycan LD-endopeptidase LytH [Gaiellales bacterium]
MRRRLITSSVAVLGAVLAAATAGSAATGPPATARAVAVQVVVPGAATTQGGASGSGSYAYRDLVSVGSYSVTTTTTARTSTAVAQLSGVSLLGGIVQISALSAAIRATAPGTDDPVGDFGGSIATVTVNGAAVGAGTGSRIDIPDLGYATVDQRIVSSQPHADAYRGSEIAFTLHLDVGWHDMPAGTEVLVGYADAGISRVQAPPERGGKAAPPAPATAPSTATTSAAGAVSLLPTAPLPSDLSGEPGMAYGGPPGSDAAPPGGYALDAPIDPARKAALLGPSYLFPLAGGARFQNDFGAPRADTRFNQGVDLFAPLGTPVLAAHDGTLVQVGWSNIGGRQEWLRDDTGNLFYYGHLSAYAPVAKTGAAVHAGDVIGFLGDSGDAQGTAYHLHFEIHPAGKWAVAPYAYVSAWLDNSAPLGGVTPARQHPVALVPLASFDISTATGLAPQTVVAAGNGPSDLAGGTGAIVGGQPAPSAAQLLAPSTPGDPFSSGG